MDPTILRATAFSDKPMGKINIGGYMKRQKREWAIFLAAALTSPLVLAGEVKQDISAGFNYKDINVKEAKFEEYRVIPKGLFIDQYGLGLSQDSYDLSVNITRPLLADQFAELLYRREGLKF